MFTYSAIYAFSNPTNKTKKKKSNNVSVQENPFFPPFTIL